jgi:hypothetical protein
MDLFDVKRRDVLDFDNYMNLKKPEFGGPKSAEYARDLKTGKPLPTESKKNRLSSHRRVVERDPMWGSPHYNSTYKALTHDLVYKQAGKKPFTYADPYMTGIATVEVGKYDVKESLIPTFESFTKSGAYVYSPSKSNKIEGSIKATVELNKEVEKLVKKGQKTLADLQKKEHDVLTEGVYVSFDKFSMSEAHEDFYMDTETEVAPSETETEVDTEVEKTGPAFPPKRRDGVEIAPKNYDDNIEAAVAFLFQIAGIPPEQAAQAIGLAVAGEIEDEGDLPPLDNGLSDNEEDIIAYIDTAEGPYGDEYEEEEIAYGTNPDEELDAKAESLATEEEEEETPLGAGPDCY